MKNKGVFANRYRLSEAASLGLLLEVRCARCRRSPVIFLALDLVQVFDPNRDCFDPPLFPCSGCGSDRYIEIKLRPPEEAAVGEVFGTLAVVVAVILTRSRSIWNSSATTCATFRCRPWPISVPPWFMWTEPSV